MKRRRVAALGCVALFVPILFAVTACPTGPGGEADGCTDCDAEAGTPRDGGEPVDGEVTETCKVGQSPSGCDQRGSCKWTCRGCVPETQDVESCPDSGDTGDGEDAPDPEDTSVDGGDVASDAADTGDGSDGETAPVQDEGIFTWARYDVQYGYQDLARGPNGAVYVVGRISGKAAGERYNGGSADGMLVKFSSSGVRQWVEVVGTEVEDELRTVAVDDSGIIYAAGRTRHTLAGGDDDKPEERAFLVKFDGDGQRQWTEGLLAGPPPLAADLGVVDGDPVVVGSADAEASGVTVGDGSEQFLARYDGETGERNWVEFTGGDGDDRGLAMAKSPDGSTIYWLTALLADQGTDSTAMSLRATPADGSSTQTVALSDAGTRNFYDLEVGSDGKVWLVGDVEVANRDDTDVLVVRRASFDGNTSTTTFGTDGDDSGSALVVDDGIWVTGIQRDYFGEADQYSEGILARLDASGTVQDRKVYGPVVDGGDRRILPTALVARSGDGVYISGRTGKTLDATEQFDRMWSFLAKY